MSASACLDLYVLTRLQRLRCSGAWLPCVLLYLYNSVLWWVWVAALHGWNIKAVLDDVTSTIEPKHVAGAAKAASCAGYQGSVEEALAYIVS